MDNSIFDEMLLQFSDFFVENYGLCNWKNETEGELSYMICSNKTFFMWFSNWKVMIEFMKLSSAFISSDASVDKSLQFWFLDLFYDKTKRQKLLKSL